MASVLYLCNHAAPIAPRFCVALIGPQTVAFEIAEWRQLIAAQLPFAELVVMDLEENEPPPPPVTFCGGAFAPSSYIRLLLGLGLADAALRTPLEALLAALEATALALQAQTAEHERRLAPLVRALTPQAPQAAPLRLMVHPDRHPPTTTSAAVTSLWLDPATMPQVLLLVGEEDSCQQVAAHAPKPKKQTRDVKTMTEGVSFLQRQASEMKSIARRRLLHPPPPTTATDQTGEPH